MELVLYDDKKFDHLLPVDPKVRQEELRDEIECLISDAIKIGNEVSRERKRTRRLANNIKSSKRRLSLMVGNRKATKDLIVTEKQIRFYEIDLKIVVYQFNHPKSLFSPEYLVFRPCPGCRKAIAYHHKPCNTSTLRIRPPETTLHIMFCPEYRKLGKMVNCNECKLTFLDDKGLKLHNHTFHWPKRPDWMAPVVFMAGHRNGPKRTVQCEGCEQSFEAVFYNRQIVPKLEFYVHCIEKCDKYKALGLIRECKIDGYKFLNERNLILHHAHQHKDLKTICKSRVDDECKGCGKSFATYSQTGNGRGSKSEMFIAHLYSCEEYRRKGFIVNCDSCNLEFYSEMSLNYHRVKVHENRPPRPDWMPLSAYHQSFGFTKFQDRGSLSSSSNVVVDPNAPPDMTSSLPMASTIECEGCEGEFEAYVDVRGVKIPCFDYYIHCIEKCKQYKRLKLVVTCKCGLKFLHIHAFRTHDVYCKSK